MKSGMGTESLADPTLCFDGNNARIMLRGVVACPRFSCRHPSTARNCRFEPAPADSGDENQSQQLSWLSVSS